MEEDHDEASIHAVSRRKLMYPLSNHIKIGIIGTTNVGKSTLFNIFSKSNGRRAEVDDCLFCTIDPSISTINTPDDKFEWLQGLWNPKHSSRTKVSVTDTAGIVAGSYLENNGVGCSSLNALRNADIILHVIRAFESSNVVHYEASLDAVRDLRVVNQEILLMDIDTLEHALIHIETIKFDKLGAELLQFQYSTIIKAWQFMAGRIRPEPDSDKMKKPRPRYRRSRLPKVCTGSAIRHGRWERREREVLESFNLISAKEVIYLVNETRRDFLRKRVTPFYTAVKEAVSQSDLGEVSSEVISVSMEFETYLHGIEQHDSIEEYMAANPTHVSIIPFLIRSCYRNLGLHQFYMASDKEVKCYLVKQGTTIKDASALVDVNIYRNFIRGDVVQFDDYYQYNGDKTQLLIEGKWKSEAKKYVVSSGDIVEFFWHHSRK